MKEVADFQEEIKRNRKSPLIEGIIGLEKLNYK